MTDFMGPRRWESRTRGPRYGRRASYEIAATWLADCETVADWGGGRGYLSRFLKPDQQYTLIDGTAQPEALVPMTVADVTSYEEPAEGVLLRHVLEVLGPTAAQKTLRHARTAFIKRLVLITCTPDAPQAQVYSHDLAWPIWQFNHATDLLPLLQPFLVRQLDIPGGLKKFPERVYLLEKPEAAR